MAMDRKKQLQQTLFVATSGDKRKTAIQLGDCACGYRNSRAVRPNIWRSDCRINVLPVSSKSRFKVGGRKNKPYGQPETSTQGMKDNL